MFKNNRTVHAMAGLLALMIFAATLAAQQVGTIQGQVTDDTGAVIPGATVTLVNAQNKEKKTSSDENGNFSFAGLPAGQYALRVNTTGFANFQKTGIDVSPGRSVAVNAVMKVALAKQEVTVQGEVVNTVSTDPTQNAGALVLRGEDLQALSDDPDDLAADLQALAGPAAGPNGGQIFIDGFSGAQLPPKESIREIRINSNPFSAEYDRLGFGRIEIFTKPGSDKFHGSSSFNFSDGSLNARNPYAKDRAPFQQRQYGGNLGGPLTKKSSFFLDIERREINDAGIVNATILDSNLNIVPDFRQTIVTPHRRLSIAPRIDYQLNEKNTLVARYHFSENSNQNSGVGDFSLLSRALNTDQTQHTLQLTETAVLSAKAINETRFQFEHERQGRSALNTDPSINVSGSFNGGGAQTGISSNLQKQYELTNITSIAHGKHSIKFGGRVRSVGITDISPNNFGGTFTFGGSGRGVGTSISSIEQYRRTLLGLQQGLSWDAIRAMGGGPTQFSISAGNPAADINQVDIGIFAQDDWRVKPNFTLSLGLRYETQTNIHDPKDIAPRIGFAYSPDARGGKNGKTVIRGGFGVFYDRFGEDLSLNALRFNGTLQQSYILQANQINFFTSNIPSLASLQASAPQKINTIDPNARAPYVMQTAIGVERQLPHNTTIAVTYTNSRALHLLLSRNIAAPLPGTTVPVLPVNTFQYESDGVMNQNQLITNLNTRFNRRISLFSFYVLNSAKSNTDGAGTTPANQYDLRSEYGRSSRDVRHRFMLGGSLTAPWNVRLSPFIIVNSGSPFNVTIGRDLNGDTVFTDRPALATDLTRPSVVVTQFGAFDTLPAPGQAIIPRNYLEGPGSFTVNLRMSKTFGFGEKASANAAAAARGADGGFGGGPGGDRGGRGGGGGGRGGPGGMRMGGGGGGPFGEGGGGSEKRYNFTFSVSARNLLNHVNPGQPIGVLSSDRFGLSNSLAGGFGDRSAANNRRLEFQLRFSF